MRRSRQAVHDFVARHEGAERERGAHGFTHNDAVRNDAVMFDAKELTGTVKALLDFLGNKEDAVFLAGLVEFFHEDRMSRQDTAVALHGFDDHSGHFRCGQVRGKRRFHRLHAIAFDLFVALVDSVKREGVNLRQKRPHLRVHTCRARCHRARTVRIAVIAVDENNDLLTTRECTGKLNGGIVGVAPAVSETNLGLDAARIHGNKALGILGRLLVIRIGGRVLRELLELLFNGLGNNRVGAPDVQ